VYRRFRETCCFHRGNSDLGMCVSERETISMQAAFTKRSWVPSYTRHYSHFIEPEGSLPCSQQPPTGPYHGSDKHISKPPSYSWGDLSPTSHRGNLDSIPGQSVWDLWGTKCHWDRFMFKYFDFSLSVSFHHCSLLTFLSSITDAIQS